MQAINTSFRSNGKMTLGMPVKCASRDLVEEIMKALKSVEGYGSIEIYIQDRSVTQITVRNIKKTRHTLTE